MNVYTYTNFLLNLGKKIENLLADGGKLALFTNSYALNTNTDCAYSVSAPAQPTVSNSGSGGTIAAGTYQVEVTYVNQQGETTASTSQSTTTTGSTSTITITSPADPGGSVTGWYAYVTQAGGSTYTRQQTAGSPTAIGSNLTLTAPPTNTGANPPTGNTACITGTTGNELSTGGGYTVGGQALSSITWTEITQASFTRSWAANTAYALGQIVAASSSLFKCVAAGTSGASAPSWSNSKMTITTDNTVTWLCIGTAICSLNSALSGGYNVSWTVTSPLTWRYAVLYDSTTSDLICYIDPLSSQTGPSSGTIAFTWDAAAGLLAFY